MSLTQAELERLRAEYATAREARDDRYSAEDYRQNLDWVRRPGGRRAAEHAAAGKAPAGSDADTRMAAAVANWRQAVTNAHWGAS